MGTFTTDNPILHLKLQFRAVLANLFSEVLDGRVVVGVAVDENLRYHAQFVPFQLVNEVSEVMPNLITGARFAVLFDTQLKFTDDWMLPTS